MKAKISILCSFVFTLLLIVSTAMAQDDAKTVKGGVLNGKAVSLPLPAYPAAAKAVNAGGAVNVQILVDQDGNVTSAKAISGHPLLRQASEKAALEAKFKPFILSGKAVKVGGVLVYNFVGNSSQKAAQENTANDDKKDFILNGRALKLPLPDYPAAAKAVRAGGTVKVKVTVDEKGKVVATEVVSGHPLLRAAAEEAARKAEFEPTIINGKPAEISGVIVYNFANSSKK